MCVIAVCKYVRLTDEQVEQMWDSNPQGGGVAWRDEDENGVPIVRWHKWLDKEDMKNYNRDLPMPYVLHFRVASQDTSKSPQACHPFAIDEEASYDIEGQTPGHVMFHNGYWTNWRDKLQSLSLSGKIRIPSGPWSDSRGLALAAHHLGLGFLEMANEKVVALGPNTDDVELFGKWYMIKNPDDEGQERPIFVSNTGWEKSFTQPTTSAVNDRRRADVTALARRDGGAADGTFRGSHGPIVCGPSDIQNREEEIQSGSSQTGAAVWSSVSRMCQGVGCQKLTRTGQIHNDRFYCMQCWSTLTQREQLWGECETCHVARASSRRIDDDKWICMTCWNTNGQPRVRFIIGNREAYD